MLSTIERPQHRLESLDFTLPPSLEAREPPDARGLARDDVRLLVSYREDDRVVDTTFRDLPRLLHPGDLIVVNDSATLPAALSVLRDDGSQLALHLSTQLAPDEWVVEPRHAAVREGEILELPGGATARLLATYRGSSRLWVAQLALPTSLSAYLHTWGRPISYPHVERDWPLEAYQTVFASRPGSAEMPSAGRALSARTLEALADRGVAVRAITLHTGVASPEADEPPSAEWFAVSDETAAAIRSARARHSRVVAVGTTVVRAAESAADDNGDVRGLSGWTDLVITPERGAASIDALLTGFHEPRASHLQMLEAIADRRHIQVAYAHALDRGYLWHEFGDLHLIL